MDNFTTKQDEIDNYFEEQRKITLQNEIAFEKLRFSLVPPLEPGDFVVVCDQEVKARFKNSPDASVKCAKYLLYELRQPCFVHREPMPEEENLIAEFLPLEIEINETK
jgi:hypothetical protein